MAYFCIVIVCLIFTGCSTNNVHSSTNGDIRSDEEKEKSTSEQKNPLTNMAVHFIDVGQADATLLQFSDEDERIIYDAHRYW